MTTPSPNEVRLTREELYELVWTEPMQTLAKKYGLSDVGLAKVCKRMRIPTPWRGYWARKAAGQQLGRDRLPKLAAALAEELAAVVIRKPSGARAAMIDDVGPVSQQRSFEALNENRILVQERLDNPHPLVQAAVHALRRAKPNKDSGVLELATPAPILSVEVTLATVDRAMCVFDALIRALELRQMSVRVEPPGRNSYGQDTPAKTVVSIGEELVEIRLGERVLRKQAGPETRGGREHRSWTDPQYVWIATGQLEVQIQSYWAEGIRKTWGDGKRRVEEYLNDFIVALVAAAEAHRQHRLETEERNRQFQLEEERRQRAIQEREDRAARIRALKHAVARWNLSRDIRAYIAESRAAIDRGAAAGEDFQDWLTWAQGYVDRLDPLAGKLLVPEDPDPEKRREY